MDVQYTITQRIRDQVPELRQVDGALELDAVLSGAVLPATPAAFVVLTTEQPAPDEGFSGGLIQRITSYWRVIFVIDNYADATGSAIAPQLQSLRVAVRRALLGWVPDAENGEPLQADTCELIDVINGRTFWGDGYLINHYWSQQ